MTISIGSKQALLARWALVGGLILLCAPWFLTSNKLYHQLLAVMLWLPGLLALCLPDFRRSLRLPEVVLFGMFSLWTLLVLAVEGGESVSSTAKLPLYVALSLLGILLAAQDTHWKLECMLKLSIFVGGLLALLSLIYFLTLGELQKGQRLIAIGLWDTTIMAAHAIGALAVMGASMISRRAIAPARWLPVLLLSMSGYLLFLLFSQTRGVWLALLATLLLIAMLSPTRWSRILALGIILMGVLVALLLPEVLMQRGLSYRPTLFVGGLELLRGNELTGIGFAGYELLVPENGKTYKHPHNLYLDIAIRLGLPGLLLFSALWVCVAWRGWQQRAAPLGRALLALWCFSSVALLTDGIGLWYKPNADWLITWLPVALSVVLAAREKQGLSPVSTLQMPS